MYTKRHTLNYHSDRYDKDSTVPEGYVSDGATRAIDIYSQGWWVHDWLCGNYFGTGPRPPNMEWDDGTKTTNRQRSQVLSDILKSEGFYWRSKYWFTMTYLWGLFN